MTKFKKNIVYILILWLTLQSQFFWYSFAWCYEMRYRLYEWNKDCVTKASEIKKENESKQNTTTCSACKATPVAMQSFINFEVELLWILQSANWQSEKFWTNKSSWIFAWGLLSLPEAFIKSTIERTKKTLDDEIKAVRAARITTVLLTTMSVLGIQDSLNSMEILFKEEAFVRDYKTLQELELSINDVIWDMWVSWIWDSRVSTSVKSDLIWLQNKYSQSNWENTVFEKISISSDIKYKQLLLFTLKLNSIIKSMLMNIDNNTPQMDTAILNFEKEYSDWDIIIKINREYIESMKRDYSCISYSTCNKTVKDALKWLLDTKKIKESFWRTKDTIKDANQNLKDALITNIYTKKDDEKKWIWWLTDRQVELLYIVYWIDAHDLTTSQIETLKQNLEQTKEEQQPLTDGYKDLKNTSKKIINTLKTTWKWVLDLVKSRINKIKSKWTEQENEYINWLTEQEKEELSQQIYWQKIIPLSDSENVFVKSMQDTVNEILIEKWKDKENLLVWINQDTHYFVEIWWIIHSIVNDEIWNKDWWLVKILWETCDYQCKNHKGSCYSD